MKVNNISRFFILGSAVATIGLGGVSCNVVLDEQSLAPDITEENVRTKVVQLADDYTTDVLLVKTNTADPSEREALAGVEGVASVEKIFPSTQGKEELEAWSEIHGKCCIFEKFDL